MWLNNYISFLAFAIGLPALAADSKQPLSFGDQCAFRSQFLNGIVKSSLSVEEVFRSPAVQEADLVALGEKHEMYTTGSYPMLLDRLKESAPNLDCLVLEVPDTQEDEDHLKRIIQNLPSPDGAMTGFPIGRAGWGPLVREAAAKGMKVFGIDAPQELFSPVEAASDEGVGFRNRHMAENILALRTSGTCHQILGVFGKVHLSAQYNGTSSTTTLPDDLRGKAKVVALDIIATRMTDPDQFDHADNGEWLWGCNSDPLPPDRLLVLPGAPAPTSLKVSLDSDLWGKYTDVHWRDFDFHLVFPPGKKPEPFPLY